MMSAMTCSNEVRGYYKQTNGTTVFYYFPHGVETSLRKGMNLICMLAEIGQCSMINLNNSNDTTILNATAK